MKARFLIPVFAAALPIAAWFVFKPAVRPASTSLPTVQASSLSAFVYGPLPKGNTMPTFTAGTDDNELNSTGSTAGTTGFNGQIRIGATLVFDQTAFTVNGDGWGIEQVISGKNPMGITIPSGAVNGTYDARWYDDEFSVWRSAPFTVEGGADPPPTRRPSMMERKFQQQRRTAW